MRKVLLILGLVLLYYPSYHPYLCGEHSFCNP